MEREQEYTGTMNGAERTNDEPKGVSENAAATEEETAENDGTEETENPSLDELAG